MIELSILKLAGLCIGCGIIGFIIGILICRKIYEAELQNLIARLQKTKQEAKEANDAILDGLLLHLKK